MIKKVVQIARYAKTLASAIRGKNNNHDTIKIDKQVKLFQVKSSPVGKDNYKKSTASTYINKQENLRDIITNFRRKRMCTFVCTLARENIGETVSHVVQPFPFPLFG